MESMKKRIEKDPKLGEDQLNDHNSIEEMLMLGYFLKTMKLVTMILNISFFVGIFFYVACDLQAQFYQSYYELPEGCSTEACNLCIKGAPFCPDCDETTQAFCEAKKKWDFWYENKEWEAAS